MKAELAQPAPLPWGFLHRLAAALSVERLDLDAVLGEDFRLLAHIGHRGFPGAALRDRDADHVLRAGGVRKESAQGRQTKDAPCLGPMLHRVLPAILCPLSDMLAQRRAMQQCIRARQLADPCGLAADRV